MDRLIRILFALFLSVGITASEVRLPVQRPMDCCATDEDGACPCGMPMPKGTQPCGTNLPSPAAAPARAGTLVVEAVPSADRTNPEPRPWPAAWAVDPRLGAEGRRSAEPIPVDTGPPPLASERMSRLEVFRI